jgi:class 3 adenylate cyclase
VQIFDVQFAEITILDHEKMISMAAHFESKQEIKDMILSLKKPMKVDHDGDPWLCGCTRSAGLCNYVAYTGCTFTSHDVWTDESLRWVRDMNGMRFYSSSPIVVNGYVVANLCIYDFVRPRPEFGAAQQLQQEQIADMAAQHLQNWSLRRQINLLNRDQRLSLWKLDKKNKAPKNEAAIVCTDIQDSSALWEANPDAMHEALRLHDDILRTAIAMHHGYEIVTEGDSFRIAFHDAIDAIGFALMVQERLYSADWKEEILALPQASHDTVQCMRGLRVRIALHYGPVTSIDDKATGKRDYSGETVYITKSLEAVCHGGQTVMTAEVWNLVSHLSATKFGTPQVVDLGNHILPIGSKKNQGVTVKGIVQLVPASLSYDYAARCTERGYGECNNTDIPTIQGRTFARLDSMKQMSASFHDAPSVDNIATIVFVYTCEVEAIFEDASNILAALTQQIRALLSVGPGYQCKNFMLAFPNERSAVIFGLDLQEHVSTSLVLNKSLSGLLKIGIHNGTFTSMGPDRQSGRADYFGKVMNRAARVAGAAEPGQVVLGKMLADARLEIDGVSTVYLGVRTLKGLAEEVALYACHRVHSK